MFSTADGVDSLNIQDSKKTSISLENLNQNTRDCCILIGTLDNFQVNL